MSLVTKLFKNNWVVLALLTVVILAVYANSLGNSFVTDDEGLVKEGDNLLTLGRIFQDYSAPLRTSLYSITYLLFDLQPWAYRLSTILFHLGNSFLAFLIIRKLINPRVAILSSLLFAVHPLLSETVVWVSGGGYAQYSFFFLLSFWFYLQKGKYTYYLSLLFFVLMLLSLNRALVLAGVFLVYEFSFGDLKKNWKKLLPFFALSGVWILLFLTNIGERASSLEKIYYRDGYFYNPLIQWPLAIGSYLRLLFWPGHLTYVHTNTQTVFQYALNIGILVGYLASLVYAFFKNKLIFFWLAFFLIPLLPNLTPFKIAFIVAERYAYLGSLGIIVLVSLGLARLFKIKELRLVAGFLIILVLVGFSIRTVVRNTDWKSPETLWQKTAEVSQDSSQAHLNLGVKYGKEGNLQAAEEEFVKAIQINPKIAEYYYNLGVVYIKTGRVDLAKENFEKALELKPGYEEAEKGLEVIKKAQGQ
jgi:tetratricopeptide (TPR) repeat protein